MCQMPQLRRLQGTTGNPLLGIVEDADVVLLFRTAENSEESTRTFAMMDALKAAKLSLLHVSADLHL